MLFNRKKFFEGYRAKFGGDDGVSQQEVDGLTRLLDSVERDPHIKDLRWFAYMLATVRHETAYTFHPIHEYGGKAYFIRRYGGHTRKGKELGNDTREEGYFYAGKGDVQLTGESNYERAENAIREEYPELVLDFERRTGKIFDLTVGDQPNDEKDPMNVMDPAISYAIMSYGMRHGMFTGRKLGHYITGTKADYKGARKIINGTDKDDEIAAVARKFEAILKASVESAAVREPIAPAPPVAEKPVEEAKIVTIEAPAVPVQTVTAEPQTDHSKIDSAIKTWSARWVAIPTSVLTMLAAFWAWLKDSPVNLIITLVIAAAAVAVIYFGLRQISAMIRDAGERKAKREADARAHEIQMALLTSAASKDMNTIALVPPVTVLDAGAAQTEVTPNE